MLIVHTSDTHMQHGGLVVPSGDVLVHSGDALCVGTPDEWHAFDAWFRSQPHRTKIFVPGNHDRELEMMYMVSWTRLREKAPYAILVDRELIVDGVRFWGSPWTPHFRNGGAFMLPRYGTRLESRMQAIPEGVDVLVTHGAPLEILDRNAAHGDGPLGDEYLRSAIYRVRPKLHLFGHLHESAGYTTRAYADGTQGLFVNGAATIYAGAVLSRRASAVPHHV